MIVDARLDVKETQTFGLNVELAMKEKSHETLA